MVAYFFRHVTTVFLLLLLPFGLAPVSAVELSVADFDFDGILGSDGATIERIGPNHFKFHLARAPGHPEWTNMCQFIITNHAAGNSLRLELGATSNEQGLRQFGSWSYDRRTWHPIRRTRADGKTTLVFPEFSEDRVFFGGEVPMSYEKMVELLKLWAKHPHASMHAIGDSLEGRTMYRLSVTDPDSPVALSRRWGHHVVNQHCYEYNAMWRIAGMIDWLLSQEGAEARQRNVWHFVVQMNVDGPHNGFARVNKQGVDLNRAYSVSGWKDNPAHESQIVQRDLERLAATETPLTTTWSMHTWSGPEIEIMLRPGPEMGSRVGPWTTLRDIIEGNDQHNRAKPLHVLASKPSPTHWCSGTHLQLKTSAFCVEGGGANLTKEGNMQSGALLIKSVCQFYGPVPAQSSPSAVGGR